MKDRMVTELGVRSSSPRRASRAWTVSLGLLAAITATGAPTLGSQRSQQLTAQGLAQLHAHNESDALRLLNEAVEADPGDAMARYYRGVCRGRLEQLPEAISDLRAALELDPTFAPAALELGSALVQTGAYSEALVPLAQARQDSTTSARAALFQGIAYLRLDQPAEARTALEAAAQDPTLAAAAQYYLGVLAYQTQSWDEAASRFAAVVDLSPDSSIGREATAFLHRLQGLRPRWYRLYASLGLQYDSNVVLAPATDIPQLGISQQADGRVVINAAADVAPWQGEYGSVVAGYGFFQSLQFQLTDFNLQEHRVSTQATGNWQWLRYGLLGRYSYYLLETSSFLQEATGLPWLEAAEGNFGRAELYFRTRYRDFLLRPYSPQLDAMNYAVGVRQVFYLGRPERYFAIGYQFDDQDPTNSSGDQFGYDGQEVNATAGWILPADIEAEAGYSYRHERYAAASMGRVDTPNQFVVGLTRKLTDYLAVNLAYLGVIHNSNRVEFDYNRNIVSLILEAAY
jgi:Flp pilus assembly protein TadD